MTAVLADLGVVGLGVMGANLALNVAEHGFPVAVYNRTAAKTRELLDQAGELPLRAADSLPDFVALLARPRAILIMVSAGPAVDAVMEELLPLLEAGDLLIDGGNSHFSDTARRAKFLEEKGLLFLGLGVSGGQEGARRGPSLMPGGSRPGFARVAPILTAIAAKVQGEPCVAYLGPGGAGHFVKMVHNGIEYGLEQLIAEAYDLLKRGLGLGNDEIGRIFRRWNEGELQSYLLEISGDIFNHQDPQTGQAVVDIILDVAGQKGTGIWTSMAALELGVPVPSIDLAVSSRFLSTLKSQRQEASRVLAGPEEANLPDQGALPARLKNALYAATLVTYAQGLALLSQASEKYNYGLDLVQVARLWRGGCIIRAVLLNDLAAAYARRPDLPHVLLDRALGQAVMQRQDDWRAVVQAAAAWGIPAPGLMVSLAYVDALRSERLPANLIQAQRDYFGAHTYARIDAPGAFHTDWRKAKGEA